MHTTQKTSAKDWDSGDSIVSSESKHSKCIIYKVWFIKTGSLIEHLGPFFLKKGPVKNSNNNEKHLEYALLLTTVLNVIATVPRRCA